MAQPLRIGAVSYLNTKPLVYRLEEFAPDASIHFDLPSRLADDLRAGQLDVALIPAIEYFRNREYTVVSDACIACRGPVLSVKLFSRVPVGQIRSLALDEGSRTSAAMVQLLLRKKWDLWPEVNCLPIGHGLGDVDSDAVLLIGDRAIHATHDDFPLSWDLGEVWCREMGLPFVFAMWTARPGVDLSTIGWSLGQARDEGLAHLPLIAQEQAKTVGLSPDQCLNYLRDNLYFYLTERERRGVSLFYQLASQHGFAPENRELRFHDFQTAR